MPHTPGAHVECTAYISIVSAYTFESDKDQVNIPDSRSRQAWSFADYIASGCRYIGMMKLGSWTMMLDKLRLAIKTGRCTLRCWTLCVDVSGKSSYDGADLL